MASAAGSGLPLASVEVLASLVHHRLLSTDQVRAIHRLGAERRWAQKVLARLREAGLAQRVGAPRRGARIWFATERGHRVAREAGALGDVGRVVSAEEASSQLQAHTIAVNDAAICFMGAARERGDEFGALSWSHEVFHPLRAGRDRHRQALSADAVLTYLRAEEGRTALEQRFLELDRATLSVDRLASELARYADLFRANDEEGEPLWRTSYPRFPGVLCVLAGASRAALERRRAAALALLRVDSQLARTPEVAISVCLLEDLRERGPFAPIFQMARGPRGELDWLGRAVEEERR